ncbi:MAG: dephospho-CoA kinase [Gammaproteobacteria bacterium]|nr:dephospho-CoA kinase [Gammaproteobacteria bacterium]
MPLRLRIGLTGGIAAGKSTVGARFAALGVPVIDADDVAREVVRPGTAGLAALVRHIGSDIVDGRGALDRGALRERIFADQRLRQAVEDIIHPRVRAVLVTWMETTDAPYGVLAVPLLFESGMDALVDRVLVVDVPEETQLSRVMARDGWDEAAARGALARQLDRWERRARAHDCIDNRGTVAKLAQAVDALHRQYLSLAEGHLPARHE